MSRPFVIIESPYRSKDKPEADAGYLIYLRRCLRHSWGEGENPFASHAYYPFFLDESKLDERKSGIAAGYSWWPHAQKFIFYTDYGMSPGMNAALDRIMHQHLSDKMIVRTIGINP